MRVVGIIAECNPFHEGHAYLIRRAKELCSADFAVIIMNGDFVQRGEPAIFNKYMRTRAALQGGADLVFELPLRFGISSAGDFALGGVLALNSLGFVTDLCFGSECGNLDILSRIAEELIEESDEFQKTLSQSLSTGHSYPTARAGALKKADASYADVLRQPNNILGVEYCLALRRTNSALTPHTIKRAGMAYHETRQGGHKFPSASSLRNTICKNELPHLCLDDFSGAIGYALMSSENLSSYKDISVKLAGRMQHFLPDYTTASGFISRCSTRAYTKSRIQRGILQCLFQVRDTVPDMPYLRLLGMKTGHSSATKLLRHIPGYAAGSGCGTTVVSRLAIDRKKLSKKEDDLLQQDIFASDLYRQTWCRKYGTNQPNEYQHSPVIL